MKIGLVSRSLEPHKGGHEIYMLHLIRSLTNFGHSIYSFAEDANKEIRKISNFSSINNVRFEQSIRKWHFCRLAKKQVSSVQEELDLVINTAKVDFGDVYIASGGVHKVFLENCGSFFDYLKPKNWFQLLIQRRLLTDNLPSLIVTHTKMVKNQIEQEFDVPSHRIETIYHGIDHEEFNPDNSKEARKSLSEEFGFNPSDNICLFTAGSWKRKGLKHVLFAMKNIQDSRIKLLIVGRTKQSKVQNFVSRLNLENQVELIGYRSDIRKFYRGSDVLVFPSEYDAAGLVVLESLACGTPVITSKTTGMHEVIEPGVNGFVVEKSNDHNAIGQYIREIFKNENQKKMADKAAKTGKKYTLDRHFTKLNQILSRHYNQKNNYD